MSSSTPSTPARVASTATGRMVPPARKASAKGLSWFAGGAVAGALDTCVTMPLDTVKTKMHLKQYAGPLSCAQAIVRADGAAGLYYGFRPFVIQASGKAAVRFCMFDALRRAVDGAGIDRSANPAAWSLTLGFGAGMAEALFWTAPTERLKILRQAKAGEGVGGAVGELSVILREQGVRGLYVGAGATAARQASSVAGRFSVLDRLSAALCGLLGHDAARDGRAPAWVTFVAGGTGGAVGAALNNPIDVVKSRIQSGQSASAVECCQTLLRERGPAAFAAGLSARVPRLFVSQAIQFTVVAQVVALLERKFS